MSPTENTFGEQSINSGQISTLKKKEKKQRQKNEKGKEERKKGKRRNRKQYFIIKLRFYA